MPTAAPTRLPGSPPPMLMPGPSARYRSAGKRAAVTEELLATATGTLTVTPTSFQADGTAACCERALSQCPALRPRAVATEESLRTCVWRTAGRARPRPRYLSGHQSEAVTPSHAHGSLVSVDPEKQGVRRIGDAFDAGRRGEPRRWRRAGSKPRRASALLCSARGMRRGLGRRRGPAAGVVDRSRAPSRGS